MGFRVSKFGEWVKAGKILQLLSTQLTLAYKARLEEDGELVLKTIRGHIDAQDLPWTPLAPHTIELKKGDDTIYVETGWLRDNLEVRKVKSPKDGITLFVGASAWKRHPSGEKFSDLMIYLEAGTDKIPPRPLVRPSWEEVEPFIRQHWPEVIGDLIVKGGV